MSTKINRKDIIGPLTDEQANHVWQILHDAGEPVARTRADYDFTGTLSLNYKYNLWGLYPRQPTISYNDFVSKMSAPNPKWLNTKWDVRNWTKDQKIAFQEECFRLGYSWHEDKIVTRLNATGYNIDNYGYFGYWSGNIDNFEESRFGTEKKWEDMFPTSSIEVENPSQDTSDHECWQYYSRTVDACLKCHPEKNLFNKNLYAVKGTDSACDGIPDPSAIRSASELWGILDTARREREYIEEVRRGRK